MKKINLEQFEADRSQRELKQETSYRNVTAWYEEENMEDLD